MRCDEWNDIAFLEVPSLYCSLPETTMESAKVCLLAHPESSCRPFVPALRTTSCTDRLRLIWRFLVSVDADLGGGGLFSGRYRYPPIFVTISRSGSYPKLIVSSDFTEGKVASLLGNFSVQGFWSP